MSDLKKLRGLKALVQDAVEQGATAIEKVHLGTARRTFDVLEKVPAIDKPAQVVHGVHDAIVSSVYGSVRVVNSVVGKAADALLDAVDEGEAEGDAEATPAAESGDKPQGE